MKIHQQLFSSYPANRQTDRQRDNTGECRTRSPRSGEDKYQRPHPVGHSTTTVNLRQYNYVKLPINRYAQNKRLKLVDCALCSAINNQHQTVVQTRRTCQSTRILLEINLPGGQ